MPFDLTDGKDKITRELRAVLKDRFLLMRSLLRVPTKSYGVLPLDPWPAQRHYLEHQTSADLLLKARQLGITTVVCADFFLDTIFTPYLTTVSIAQDDIAAVSVVMRIYKFFYETMPDTITLQGIPIHVKPTVSSYSDHLIAFDELGGRPLRSKIRVGTAGSIRLVRGETVHRLHGTEVALWPEETAEGVVAAFEGAMSSSGTRRVLESTANGASGFFFNLWEASRRGATGYKTHFYPFWLDPYARLPADSAEAGQLNLCHLEPTEHEAQLMLLHGLDFDQIRWYRARQMRMQRLYKQEAASDDITCFLVSGSTVFDPDALLWYAEHVREPLRIYDELHMWIPPAPGEAYVIGADSGGGTSVESDFCAAVVLNAKTLEHCASLHGRFAPREFGQSVADLGHRYNDALIAPERTGAGAALLLVLEEYIGYPNIYIDHDSKSGWFTSRSNKPTMIDELKLVVDNRMLKTYDPLLVAELRSFSEMRRGDALVMKAASGYDDLVMAMAIAVTIRHQAESGQTSKIIRYGW